MNKRILFYGLVALFALTTIISCNDNPTNTGSIQEDTNNNATQIMNTQENGKDMITSGVFKMKVKVGHLASQCSPGCVYMNGRYSHLDCMGQGNTCNLAATVKLTLESTMSDINYYNGITLYEYEFTTEDYFQFPARSLWVYNEFTGTECWMNIPEQLLVRDSNTHQFLYKGIYFSNKQEYVNE